MSLSVADGRIFKGRFSPLLTVSLLVIIPTEIVTSFSGSSLLFFVLFVDFAQKNELLLGPFLALYDLKLGKKNYLVFGESGGSVVFLVDSADDATRKTSQPHFGQYL